MLYSHQQASPLVQEQAQAGMAMGLGLEPVLAFLLVPVPVQATVLHQ
jgi:hypothetical protein